MAQLTGATIPQVRIYCFDNLDRNIKVPAQKATEHRVLVTIARQQYGRDKYLEDAYDVHFHYMSVHVGEHHCNTELNDMLYNEGAYFFRPYAREQMLKLYAHFVPTSMNTYVETPIKMETLEGLDNPGAILDDTSTPRQWRAKTFSLRRQPDPSPLLDVCSDNESLHNDPLPTRPTKKARVSGAPDSTDAASVVTRYPALPVEATPAKFLEAFHSEVSKELALLHSANIGDKSRMVIARRKAHGTLSGSGSIFSVVAADPCKRCVQDGMICRIYHPSMDLGPWARELYNLSTNFRNRRELGSKCSLCRDLKRYFCWA